MKISFKTDNAAFDGAYRYDEIATVIRKVADEVAEGKMHGLIFDKNRNRIGMWVNL